MTVINEIDDGTRDMEVNLRKASNLSKALLEAGRKLSLSRTVTVSIYDTSVVQTRVDQSKGKLLSNIADARALIHAAFALRHRIGEANAVSGVDSLLTEKARLDAEEKLMASIVTEDSDSYGAALEAGIAQTKLVTMRRGAEAATSSYLSQETLNVLIATDDVVDPIKDTLATIRRRKIEIADELLALNTTTKVEVPLSAETLAVKFKLI